MDFKAPFWNNGYVQIQKMSLLQKKRDVRVKSRVKGSYFMSEQSEFVFFCLCFLHLFIHLTGVQSGETNPPASPPQPPPYSEVANQDIAEALTANQIAQNPANQISQNPSSH